MPWPKFWSSSPPPTDTKEEENSLDHPPSNLISRISSTANTLRSTLSSTPQDTNGAATTSAFSTDIDLLTSISHPSTLLATALLTTTIFALTALSRRYLRRIPTAPAIPPAYIFPSTRQFTRSLFGRVTSVGDADNFRLYHTPLGRLALWGLFRRVPTDAKALRGQTVHIRLAGIDAPELSHFGRPAQPYSQDAMDWLTSYLRGRRVRCYVHKIDQYGRAVATVYVRKGILRRDVGLQMLKTGLATVYEAKSGAVFGGEGVEKVYRSTEEQAKRKGKGMWAAEKGGPKVETPREYKNKYREGGNATTTQGKS